MIPLVAAALLLAQVEGEVPSAPGDQVVIVDEDEPAAEARSESESESESQSESEPESESDEIIIIDDEPARDEVIAIDDGEDAEQAGDDEVLIIEDDAVEPEDEPEPALTWGDSGRTFVKVELSSRLLIDARFDDTRRGPLERTGEDVLEWWNVGELWIDHKQGRELSLVADAWVRWGVVGEHPGEHAFVIVNPRDTKWTGEVELREGYVQWRPGGFDIKVGQRIFVWGKNELFAAADVLNPIDLRFDPMRLIDSPKDLKVPIFALDVSHWWGDLGVQLVVAPFFTANRVALTGRDFALAPPGSPLEAELAAIGQVHPSIEDELQGALNGTEVPEESPEQASLALRGLANLGGWDLGVTAYYGWDRTPRVRVDPDLRLLAGAADRILANPQVLITDPELRDASLGVQQKTLVGEELIRARYKRMWLFALEAQGVIGDFVARADVGFSPERTFYTEQYAPVWKPSLTGAVGLEYTRGEEWYLAVTGYTLTVFDAPEARLLGIEGADTNPGARDVAALLGVSGTIRWRWVDEGIELSANGGYDIQPGDSFVTIDVAYDHFEPHTFRAGLALLDGPAATLGRNYTRNDFAYVAYQGAW